MAETHNHLQNPTPTSRMGLRHAAGEIVEVQGGHIVRSTGRKDRHSKVCTAKGPRDRRVRLSAHTAIQFYDVQDRLGYDRPSKAVDWLIKKAKSAIDQLDELPPWNPTSSFEQNKDDRQQEEPYAGSSMQEQMMGIGNNQSENHSSSFLPPSLDSDAIADTIKSFFPMGGGGGSMAVANSSAMQFQNFPPPDLLSRTGSQSQDLRLSLQSFENPLLLHHHHHHHQQQQQNQPEQTLMGFDSAAMGFDAAASGGGGGFVFNSPPLMFGQNQFVSSQRGPLQSSNTQSIRAWMDPFSAAAADHHHHHQNLPVFPSSFAGIGFAPVGGFSGFRIPARIQGEEEEHDGVSDKPSSASSDSRH